MRTRTKTRNFFAPRATGLGGAVTRAAVTLALVMLTTATAWAQGVNYIDAAGVTQTCDSYTTLTGSETTWTGWYVASGAVEISARVAASGEAHLILTDGATLTIPKGITVTEDNSLTIYGQTLGTGSLRIASPESGYAGIGGYVISSGSAAKTGSITINGGTIDVIGSNLTAGGAAIGGVYWGNTGTITINGGSVTATGKRFGAGIGSGADASGGGTITITGGTVVATSAQGAGIGGAIKAVTPDIYISGGNVTASSTGNGTGIGAGSGQSAQIITISGGTVTATGYAGSAGIGGGNAGGSTSIPGTCGTVTISGGTVTAIGGEGAAGIGGGKAFGSGYPGNNGGTIIITGGNVTARTTYNDTYGGGYGIGHGYAGNSTGLTADIRLSYTAASNSINAQGYTGAVTITDSKTMSDGTDTYTGVLTSDEITAIAGKTLRPYKAISLTDNSDEISAWNGGYADVTLKRAFTNGVKATLCLPFDPSAALTSAKLYEFTGINGTKAEMTERTSGVTANTPYIIEPKQDIDAATGIDFGIVAIDCGADPQTTDGTAGFTFHGTYTQKHWLATSDEVTQGKIYGFMAQDNDGQTTGQFVRARRETYLRPFSCYLEYSGTLDGTQTAAARRATRADGETLPDVIDIVWLSASGEATGIRPTPSPSLNGGEWYDLLGRRLSAKPSQKGLYINNGRKVVIK